MNAFDYLEFDTLRMLKNVTIMTVSSISSNFLDYNSFGANIIEITLKTIGTYLI